MNKKIISAVLAVLMMSSTAAIAASAAEVEAEASKDSGKIQFDLGDWNHEDKIAFYVWDATAGDYCSQNGWTEDNQWGSKKLQGEDLGDGVVESYEIDFSGREDHNIFVIFHDRTTDAQTYDCVLNASAIGHKAYMTGVNLENPVDSEKTCVEAVFDGVDSSVCGPYKQITSTGNIVGNCIAPQDNGTKIVAKYIFDKMGTTDKGGEECVTEAKVENALNEFGTNADDVWAEFQTIDGHEAKDEDAKKLLKISSGDANTDTATDTDSATDTEKSSDTNNTTGNSGSTGTTKTTTTTTKSSTGTTTTTTTASNTNATASAEAGAATGDTTGTAAFGVVLAAAAATMFLARKKVED